MRKQDKLEASRDKLKYLEEETDIIRKEADLDAHLKIRKAQCAELAALHALILA
jgi:hypothetical protein